MLSLDGVDVAIGAVSILRGINMELPSAKFTGLIGRNGAGKTTLLRAIMGILKVRAGTIHMQGAPLTMPTHERALLGIGYMPEDRRLVPDLTVQDNVLMPAWAGKRVDALERLEKVYAMIPEVKAFADRRAMQLSGGQQKLVALARALMCGTKILLLDEPFEQDGLSILLTESDLSHSRELLDTLFVIDRGEVKPRPL